MTKSEYLSRLEKALKTLSEEERKEALDFYAAYFEDGGTPTDQPEEAAERILKENKENNILLEEKKENQVKKSNINIPLIILLIISSPIWLSLLVAFFSVILSVIVVIAVVPIAFLFAFVFALIYGFMMVPVYFPRALCVLGVSLFSAGITMLLFKPCLKLLVLICKGTASLTCKMWNSIKPKKGV
ncbi:MAG: DUF1700 domain-containing protein [Ruminococcus sp.]|nr:DUF1700 domain-containing protein [Ruminococcus sp.]